MEFHILKAATTTSRSSGSGINSFQELSTAQQGSTSYFTQTPIIAAVP